MKTVSLLGHYTGITRTHSFHGEKELTIFIFEKDGKTVDVDNNQEILVKEPVKLEEITLEKKLGGNPRRTRRRKNKKRRSSKQRISKK